MNQAEIRHFHRIAHLHRRESPHYYCYFVSLKNMDSFSPAAEAELLKDEPYFHRLPVIKRQLFEKILAALSDLHGNTDPEEQVKKLLHESYLLLKKQLPVAAAERLRKARKILETNGLFQLWPAWHRMDLQLAEQRVRSGRLGGQSLGHHDLWATHMQQTDTQYRAHWQKVDLYFNRYRDLSKESSQLEIEFTPEAHPAIQADQLQAAALLAFSTGKPGLAREHNAALLDNLRQLNKHNKGVPERILTTTYNLLLDHLHLENYAQLSAGLAQLRALPQQQAFRRLPRIASRVFEWGFQLEFNVYLRLRNWAKGLKRLAELQEGLGRHRDSLSAPAFASLHLLGGLIAFYSGNYQKALDFLQPLYQALKPGSAKDVYRYARYLHLLCHLELAHFDTADSLLASIKRAFPNPPLEEQDFLNCIGAILRHPLNKKAEKSRWQTSYNFQGGLEQYLLLSQWLQ